MRVRRLLPLLAAVAACVSSAPPVASAAESAVPTAQQKAYGMDWAPFIDPADLPPVAQRKVVCLVDSGVAITEDLPSDRPEGPIVQRIAVDGGSGLPGPKPEQQHGTQMASFAGAVMGNDWGTVGAWPGVRILSVRAMRYDATGFASSDWRQGIAECRVWSASLPVVAINLSLGGFTSIAEQERARLEDYVLRAHQSNINVLAAAGNRGSSTLDVPARLAGVLPIAAGEASSGQLCSYASYAASVLVGPGCALDTELNGIPAVTDGGGSSSATVFASTTVALLRSLYLKKYGTEASWESVERWLRDGASASSTGPALNGESAARLAGLADVLDRAKARASAAQFEPTTPSIAPDPDTPGRVSTDDSSGAVVAAPQTEPTSSPWNAGTAAKSPPDRLPRPRASATWRDRRLSVVLYTRSAFAGRLRIATRGPMNRTDVVQILPLGARHRFVLRARRKPRAVSIRLLPLSGDDIEPSPLLTLRPRSKGYR